MENYENIDIKTRKNKPKLQHEEFLYVFEKLSYNANTKFWRCEQFNTSDVKCRGRLHTTFEDVVLPDTVNQHNCTPKSREERKKPLGKFLRFVGVTNDPQFFRMLIFDSFLHVFSSKMLNCPLQK